MSLAEQATLSPDLVAKAVIHLARPYLARKSFRHFVPLTMPSYQVARHHLIIMTALEMLEAGMINRLIVNMPPRHGKSELVSVRFPAWYLGRHPDQDIIHVSHSADLSNDFSRRVRAMVRDDMTYQQLFPQTLLDPERQRVDDWRLTRGGGFRSRGTGGGISGHGADLMIIDDPHKEGEITPTVLAQVFEWYTTGARTRLMPGAKVLICMTRWDLKDLVGQVVAVANRDSQADQWHILNLAGLIETEEQAEVDPLGREIGESLWPDWYPPESLLALKALSEPHFEALVQQNPRAFSMEMFRSENWRRAAEIEIVGRLHESRIAWCFDLALGEDEGADYCAWSRVLYSAATKEIAFTRLYRERVTWPEAKQMIRDLIEFHPDDFFVFPKHSFELMAVQELRREFPEAKIRQVSFPAGSDKVSRAQVLADRHAAQKVWIVDSPVTQLWIDEHDQFPSSDHDDMVDAGSVATHYFGLDVEFFAAIVESEQAAVDRQKKRLAERAEVMERIGC